MSNSNAATSQLRTHCLGTEFFPYVLVLSKPHKYKHLENYFSHRNSQPWTSQKPLLEQKPLHSVSYHFNAM
jgi:hypothetical protein